MARFLEDTTAPSPEQFLATAPGFINPEHADTTRLKSLAAGAGAFARTLAGEEQSRVANKLTERKMAIESDKLQFNRNRTAKIDAENRTQRERTNVRADAQLAISKNTEKRNVKRVNEIEARKTLERKALVAVTDDLVAFNTLEVDMYKDDPVELERVAREIRQSVMSKLPNLSQAEAMRVKTRLDSLPIMQEAALQRAARLRADTEKKLAARKVQATVPKYQKEVHKQLSTLSRLGVLLNAYKSEMKGLTSAEKKNGDDREIRVAGETRYLPITAADEYAKVNREWVKTRALGTEANTQLDSLTQDPTYAQYVPQVAKDYYEKLARVREEKKARSEAAAQQQKELLLQQQRDEEAKRAAFERQASLDQAGASQSDGGAGSSAKYFNIARSPDGGSVIFQNKANGQIIELTPDEYSQLVQEQRGLLDIQQLPTVRGG